MNERKTTTRARQEARFAAERQDRALVLAALREVLADPKATSAQRLFAVAVLDRIQTYYFIPNDVKFPSVPDGDGKIRAEFTKRLETAENK